MASSKDFTANQIRTAKLILTGTQPGDGGIGVRNIGLSVYDESIASDQEGGVTDSNLYDNAGTDVAIFVSGSQLSRGENDNSGGVVLFGGDTYVSGALVVENAGRTHGSISGSIQKMSDGTDYIRVAGGLSSTSGSDGSITLDASGIGKDFSLSVINTTPPTIRLTDNSDSSFDSAQLAGSSPITTTYSAGKITFGVNTATSTTVGVSKIFDDTEQTVAAESVSSTANRTYGVQLNSSDQLVVNVPWTAGGGSGNTLDQAYDEGGAGAGSEITVDSGPVVLKNSTSGDDTLVFEYDSNTHATASITSDGKLILTTFDQGSNNSDILLNPDGKVIIRDNANNTAPTLAFTKTSGPFSTGLVEGENDYYIRRNSGNDLEVKSNNGILLQPANFDAVIVNDSGTSTDFRVESNNLASAILVDGGDDTVVLGSNVTTFAGLPAEAKGDDVAIVLSGSADSRYGSSRGVVLSTADTVVSGTLYAEGINGGAISGSITQTKEGKSYLVAGSNMTISSGSNGQITLSSTGGGGSTIIQTSVYSLMGGFSVFLSSDVTSVKNDISGYATELADGTNNAVGDGIRLNSSPDTIPGFVFRTMVPSGATKVQFTINAFATGPTGTTADFELLVSGRKFEQQTSVVTVQAQADQNDAGLNRWLNSGDFSSSWRGFTSSTQASNKFSIQQGGRMYIVNSRDINLSDLKNTSSAAIAAGDVLDIAIARNAAQEASGEVGTSQDTQAVNQGLIIHYIRVNFKA